MVYVGSCTGMERRRVDGDLYERELQVAAVEKLLASAAEGHGSTLVLVGAAGSGKTALLSLARHVAGPRFDRRHGAANPMEHHLPWSLAGELFGSDGPSGRWPRRSSDLHQITGDWLGPRDGRPLLLCVDDLHFSDHQSLELLCYAARRLSRHPVALLTASRPWPPEALRAMATVAAGGDVQLLDLPPLSRESARSLVERFVGSRDPKRVEDLVARSLGNPLVLVASAKASADPLRPPAPGFDARALADRALLTSQLAGLPADAVTCAHALAALDGEEALDLLAAVCPLPPDRFVEAHDALVTAGVLCEGADGRVAIANDVVADALDRGVAPASRQRIFRRAFEHCYDRGKMAKAVGYIDRGSLHHDPRALDAVVTAGSRAFEHGALDEALRHLDRALSLSEPDPSTPLLMRHADALYAAGRSAEAAAGYARLLTRDLSPTTRFEALSRCVRARTYSGTLDDALDLYQTLLDTGEHGTTRSAELWLERAHVIWELAGPRRALAALDETPAAVAARHPMVGLVRAFFASETGDPSGIGSLEAAGLATRRLATTDPDSALGSFNTLSLWVNTLAVTERYADALGEADFGVAWLESLGALRATIPLRIARLGILSLAGRPLEVVAEVRRMRDSLALDALSEPHVAIFEAGAVAVLGDTSRAEQILAGVASLPTANTWYASVNLRVVHARCLLDRGDADGAAEIVRDLETLVEEAGSGTPSGPPWGAVAVEAYLAAGCYPDALRVAEWLESRPDVLAPGWSQMISLSARAEHAAVVARDRSQAVALYQKAMAASSLQPLDRARVGLRFGQLLRQTGEPVRARPVLADVLATADRVGASLLSASAHAELAAAGGRRRRANRPTGLTAQERRVATHALTGAATRQIASSLHLSPRTVESHLASIYRKVGVKSRHELLARGRTFDL